MKDTRIALIGLSGSGKTTVGPLLAERLGWRYLDLDQAIEQRTGRAIAEVFAHEGEAAFRARETAALAESLTQTNVVIATGGGIVESPQNRDHLMTHSFVVWLHAPVAELARRLADATDRPLLRESPADALGQMLGRRAPLYAAIADWIVATAGLAPQQVADEIIRAHAQRTTHGTDELQVTTPGGSYALRAGAGVLAELPERLNQLGVRGRLWLISDSQVLPLHGERIVSQLARAGRAVESYAIPAGEHYKTLDTVRGVYDWLLSRGVERGDAILALGGGVVGDLAGFVAATILRGIAVVQLPTTVLAMVDSAIGGKTGVDHAAGKNLIGAFHQPRLVLADTTMLVTLPAAERAAGWAEAIKHGVIGDPALFADLRRHAADALALREPITGALISRAAAYKARIVSGDEREQGARITLNYGHTLGHAIEAESGYALRHGEAIAIGMMAEGTIAARMGLWTADELSQQRAALESFELPTRVPARLDLAAIMARTGSDKKVQARRIRWVLPTRIGATTVRDDVPPALVIEILQELQAR